MHDDGFLGPTPKVLEKSRGGGGGGRLEGLLYGLLGDTTTASGLQVFSKGRCVPLKVLGFWVQAFGLGWAPWPRDLGPIG